MVDMCTTEYRSGEPKMVPTSKVCIIAPPCINASDLLDYDKRVDGCRCIEDGTHETGLMTRRSQTTCGKTGVALSVWEQAKQGCV